MKYLLLMIAITGLLAGCTRENPHMQQFHEQVCALPEPGADASPWHIRHLYDCQTKELFIPYQLWTGAHWDGDKTASCMHPADNLNYRKRHATGPVEWKNLRTGEIEMLWHQTRPDGVVKHFKCHDKGIGKRHDSRKPNYVYWDYRCIFPAGFGWELRKQRHCLKTTIEITHLRLTPDNLLESMTHDWWVKDKFAHQFTHRPNIGRVPTPEAVRRPGVN